MRVCMPPDPNPRKPRFTPPPNSCDTHAHVFGPPEKFPFAPTRQYTPPAAPIEHYLNMLAVIGIDRGVVVQPSAHGFDNTATLDAIAKKGGRFRGIARVDDTTTAEELKGLHEGGIRGVRFNLLDRSAGNIKLMVFDRVIERLVEFGWSVDLHIDPKNLVEQEGRIRAIPVPVVFDHLARINPADGLGQEAFQLLLDFLKDERFWVKLSAVDKISRTDSRSDKGLFYTDVVPFARALIEAAPDRVIWGTDWPHSNIFVPGKTPNDGDLLDLLSEFAPDESVRHKILVDNPSRLYGFDQP
ncbi:MAG: amidohydrolase family protein [Deltaproteobacteria bacterium]|nr:amidohydrolase family protein [Deltaproteobacteria bacterium]